MKKILFVNSVVLSILGIIFVAPAAALMLDFTDTTTKEGFNIAYSLEITGTGGINYAGVFTITSSSSDDDPHSPWYIGAFDFKFFEGTGNEIPDIDDPFTSPPIGPWGIADVDDPNISIAGWKREDGRAGFYLEDLNNGLTMVNAAKGVLVSAPFGPVSFDFTFSGNGVLDEDSMSFQVAYFGELKKNPGLYFGQLSADLSVPEPTTLLLLGSGILGLTIFRKKFRNG